MRTEVWPSKGKIIGNGTVIFDGTRVGYREVHDLNLPDPPPNVLEILTGRYVQIIGMGIFRDPGITRRFRLVDLVPNIKAIYVEDPSL